MHLKFQIFLAAILISLVSCSKKSSDSLTDYITTDVSVANVVNVDELLRKAGLPLGNMATLGPEQSQLLDLATQSVMNAELTAIIEGGCIDVSQIMLLSLADRTSILAVRVTNKDAFDKVAKEKGFSSNCVNRGSLCFISDNKNVVENFLDAVDNAAPESLSEVKLSLDANKTIRAAMRLDVNEIDWLTMNVAVTQEAITMEWSALDCEGRNVAFGNLFEEIDPEVLSFIPNDAVLALAFGKPDFDNQLLNRFAQSQYGWIAEKITGTSAISVSMGGSVDNLRFAGPEAFNIQFATAASENSSPSLLDVCDEYFQGKRTSDGRYLAALSGCDLWYGQENGFVAVSFNRPFTSNYSNDLAPRFEGKRLACDLEIPNGSSLMKGLNLTSGVSLNISLTTDKLKARLRFNGSSKTAALSLLDLSADFVSFASLAPTMLF